MELFSLLTLVAFFGLASAQIDPKKQTISELYTQAEKLHDEFDKAVAGYKQHNYSMLASRAQKFEFPSFLRKWLTQPNATYGTSEEAREAYSRLINVKFQYPFLSDPAKLSDALKVEALLYGLDKDTPNSWNSKDKTMPNNTELRKAVLQIIDEENKIGRNWNKTNPELNNLYGFISVNDGFAFKVTSGFPGFALGGIKDFCATEKNVNCPPQLLETVQQFQTYENGLQKLFPIENVNVFHAVIEILENYKKQQDNIFTIIKQMPLKNHLECDAVGCRVQVRHNHTSTTTTKYN